MCVWPGWRRGDRKSSKYWWDVRSLQLEIICLRWGFLGNFSEQKPSWLSCSGAMLNVQLSCSLKLHTLLALRSPECVHLLARDIIGGRQVAVIYSQSMSVYRHGLFYRIFCRKLRMTRFVWMAWCNYYVWTRLFSCLKAPSSARFGSTYTQGTFNFLCSSDKNQRQRLLLWYIWGHTFSMDVNLS